MIEWSKIDNKTFLITGATGLVGKTLIQTLLVRNERENVHTKIIALGRNKNKFIERFADIKLTSEVKFLEHNVCNPIKCDECVDYIIHMASNTHPRLYAVDPIGTEMTNIIGTYNLLELASCNRNCKFVLTSSGDIYGDNRSNKEYFEEEDCGYINCNSLRAGYIEGKRASEALCNAFFEAKQVDFVIARLCRIFGPNMQLSDSKAISQFLLNAVKREDIVLKSSGTQRFSYLYAGDVVNALLHIITNGVTGNAYNVADNAQVMSLKELAETLAEIGKTKVIYGIQDELEAKGASTFKNVMLDDAKLKKLGWQPEYDLRNGLEYTVNELRNRM